MKRLIKDALLIAKIKSCGEWMKSQGDVVFSGAAYINLDYYAYEGDGYIIYQGLRRNNNESIKIINEGVEKIGKINKK